MRVVRIALSAALLAASLVPAAASATGRCELKWYGNDPIPSVVC